MSSKGGALWSSNGYVATGEGVRGGEGRGGEGRGGEGRGEGGRDVHVTSEVECQGLSYYSVVAINLFGGTFRDRRSVLSRGCTLCSDPDV